MLASATCEDPETLLKLRHTSYYALLEDQDENSVCIVYCL